MSMAVPSPRTLAGTTMLTVVPALGDDPDGQEVLDIAFALVRAGARVIVASAEGPLLAELQGFGGEWIECASERAGFNGVETAARSRSSSNRSASTSFTRAE